MLKELSLPYIQIVHQNNKKRQKRFKHCCEVSKDVYDMMCEEGKIRVVVRSLDHEPDKDIIQLLIAA